MTTTTQATTTQATTTQATTTQAKNFDAKDFERLLQSYCKRKSLLRQDLAKLLHFAIKSAFTRKDFSFLDMLLEKLDNTEKALCKKNAFAHFGAIRKDNGKIFFDMNSTQVTYNKKEWAILDKKQYGILAQNFKDNINTKNIFLEFSKEEKAYNINNIVQAIKRAMPKKERALLGIKYNKMYDAIMQAISDATL